MKKMLFFSIFGIAIAFLLKDVQARAIHAKNAYPTVNVTIFAQQLPPKINITLVDKKIVDRIGAVVEVIQNSISYLYIADWGNSRIIKTDENGTFITSKEYRKPVGITASNNALYYTGAHEEFYVLDFDMNLKKTIKKGAFLETIWYDKDTDYLYIADEGEPPIDSPGFIYVYKVVKDDEFTLNTTITVATAPYGLMMLLGNLYVGDENDDFIIYNNNKQVKIVEYVCNSLLEAEIWSIYGDINGNIVFPCSEAQQVLLYENKTQSFLSLPIYEAPRGVYLDSKSRLIVGTATSILIFY